MQTITLAVIAAFILVFGMISKRIQKTVITPPMIFVVFGLLLSQQALGLMDIDVEDPPWSDPLKLHKSEQSDQSVLRGAGG